MLKTLKILSGVVLFALAIFALCVRAEFLGIFAFAVAFSFLFFHPYPAGFGGGYAGFVS